MAGSVGANVTALEMCAPAGSPRITEKMQIWQSKGSAQGVHGLQKRGEARVLWPSKEQVEQVEREDKYQHGILMNNMKMINTNHMLTGNRSKQGITRQGWVSGKRETEESNRQIQERERNTEVTTFYLFQIYLF